MHRLRDFIPRISCSNEVFGETLIIISLIFFAVSFVYQRQAMLNGISPITYNACRYIVSSLCLTIMRYGMGWEMRKVEEREKYSAQRGNDAVEQAEMNRWNLIVFGSILGITNLGGSLLQQMGLVTVTAGKTGFITGMYVVIVPIAEYIFPCFHLKLTWQAGFAVISSMIGLYLLSGCAEQEQCIGGAIKKGEILVFVSVFFWVVSIMASDIGAKKLEVITLQLFDFIVTTSITLAIALLLEPNNWIYPFSSIRQNSHVIIIVGFAEAVAFTMSTAGQIYTTPTRAALLYSLEAVVCAIFSYFLLGERFTYIELFGGAIMVFSAMISTTADEVSLQDDDVDVYDSKESDETKSVLHDSILSNTKTFGSLELI